MTGTQTGKLLGTLRQLVAEPSVTCTDGELLERFAVRRDEGAFAALVRRLGPLVLGACRRVLHNAQDAEDVFQAAFLTLARKAAARSWQGSVAGWLYLTAYRLALKVRAETERRAARELRAPVRSSTDPLAEVTGRELCTVLDEELSLLPEKYRSPLLLCCLEGLSRDEAAQRLGWSAGALKGRLERGREMLRRRLIRRGITLSAGLVGLTLAGCARGAVARSLVSATVGAAGQPAAVSSQVLALSNAALRGLPALKFRMTAAVVLAVGVLGAGLGMGLSSLPEPREQPKSPRPAVAPVVTEPRELRLAEKDLYDDPLPAGVVSRLGTVRFRHEGNINSVAFSPDGKIIATGSLDNTLRLWDAATGKELCRFGEQNRPRFVAQIFCIAFSPDGKTVASGGNDNKVHLWDRASGAGRHLDAKDHGVVQALAFTPDGKTIASAHWNKDIVVWNTATGEAIHRLQGHQDKVLALVCSADGKLLLSGGADKTVRLWDTAEGKEVRKITTEMAVHGVALSPDGKLVAAGGSDKTIRLWDRATGAEVRQLVCREDWVFSVEFSPDGKTLAAATAHYAPDRNLPVGRLLLFDVASGTELRQLTKEDLHPTEAVAFSPDGKFIAAGGGHDCTLRLWDTAGKEVSPVGGHQGQIGTAVFTADARRALTTSTDGTIRLWDTATGKELRRFPGLFAHLLPDGKTLVTMSGGETPTVHIWDLGAEKERRHFSLPPSDVAMAVDPAGLTLAVPDKDHVIRLYDLATGAERGQLLGHRGRVHPLLFSSDGKWLASASFADHTVRLWDVAAKKQARSFEAGMVFSIAFSPDGSLLAAGGDDSGVRLCEAATGRVRLHLRDDKTFWARACSIHFSPDGRTLATGSMHGHLHLWEIATGQKRRSLDGDQDWVTAFAFSPNGRYLLTGGTDTTALVWDLRATVGTQPHLTEAALQALWADLAAADAAKAYQAIRTLATASPQAVPFLKTVLTPAPCGDEKRIARLVTQLDSDNFATREKAAAELEQLGEAVVPALRKVLAANPSLEVRRRCEPLLEKWDPAVPSGERLRIVRAVEALELAGTQEARALLQRLAGGGEGALLTREGREALRRTIP
jgi:RNA polymerase sigma factor (sigma-70 family)